MYKWIVECDSQCKNSGGILKLFFVSETNEKPEINCGPCGNKPISNITLAETYTISE